LGRTRSVEKNFAPRTRQPYRRGVDYFDFVRKSQFMPAGENNTPPHSNMTIGTLGCLRLVQWRRSLYQMEQSVTHEDPAYQLHTPLYLHCTRAAMRQLPTRRRRRVSPLPSMSAVRFSDSLHSNDKHFWFTAKWQLFFFVVSACQFDCLFVCAEFFSAVFDPISMKLGHMLYVWV